MAPGCPQHSRSAGCRSRTKPKIAWLEYLLRVAAARAKFENALYEPDLSRDLAVSPRIPWWIILDELNESFRQVIDVGAVRIGARAERHKNKI
jgi:hypothetical protein